MSKGRLGYAKFYLQLSISAKGQSHDRPHRLKVANIRSQQAVGLKGKTISKAKKELKEEEGGGPGNGKVAFPFYLPPETLSLPAGGPPGGGQHHYILNDLKVIYTSIFFLFLWCGSVNLFFYLFAPLNLRVTNSQ